MLKSKFHVTLLTVAQGHSCLYSDVSKSLPLFKNTQIRFKLIFHQSVSEKARTSGNKLNQRSF